MEAKKLIRPMHPLSVINEWRKGCSCSIGEGGEALHPSICKECTEAAMQAIEKWFQSSNQPPQWGEWKTVK